MTHANTMLTRSMIALAAVLALASCRAEIEIPKDPPEARKDYARTALNTPVVLNPTANDHDPTGETITVVAIGAASHGTAVLNGNGTVTYTPGTGYLGGDEFTVTVTDTSGNEVTESAYVTVGPSSRFVYMSNFADYFTNQVYLSDDAHPGVAIPVSGWLPTTVGSFQPFASVNSYHVSANGQYVLYAGDTDSLRTLSTFNLFFVNMDSPGKAIQLTDLPDGRDVTNQLAISPDGLYAYYMSNEFNPDAFEIVKVEVANPANKVRVNPALTSTVVGTDTVWQSIVRFALAPDGAHLLYVLSDSTLGPFGGRLLKVVDTAVPGTAATINGPFTGNNTGLVDNTQLGIGFKFLPGTNSVIYPSIESGSTFIDLYQVDYVAQSAPVKVSGTALAGGISTFRISPDATRIAYVSQENTSGIYELYGVDLSNPGVSTRLSKPRTTGESIGSYLIGEDSSYVVYTRDDDTENVSELYRVDFNNPTVQVKLNHALRPAIPHSTHPNVDAVPAEEVLYLQQSPGAPRSILYTTNDAPVKKYTTKTFRVVSVDAPGTGTIVGTPTGVNYYFLWADDGDTLSLIDDPERHNAISVFKSKISDPSMFIKLTPERFPGDSILIDYNFPFLP